MLSPKRIFLLANRTVGLEVARYIVESGDHIVGLAIPDETKAKYANEIISASNVEPNHVLIGKTINLPASVRYVASLKPDIIVSAFWVYILKKPLLSIAPAINLHPGYLPYNRGVHPSVWPFLDGTPAGVTIHYIDQGIDTGDIIVRKKLPIRPTDTAGLLYDRQLFEIIELFKKNWINIKNGTIRRTPQNKIPHEKASFHFARDVTGIDQIPNTKETTALINQLRSRSFTDHTFAYMRMQNRKIYIKIELSDAPDSTSFKYKQLVVRKLTMVKHGQCAEMPGNITGHMPGESYRLRVITTDDLSSKTAIRLLTQWRKDAQEWFPSQFIVTEPGTKTWIDKQVLQKEDRILFFLFRKNDVLPIGHVGLNQFDFVGRSCELDNIIKGTSDVSVKGIMTHALRDLMTWAREHLHIRHFTLRVFSDNTRAIALYKRLGFVEQSRVPLVRVVKKDMVEWVEKPTNKPRRYFVTMSKDA